MLPVDFGKRRCQCSHIVIRVGDHRPQQFLVAKQRGKDTQRNFRRLCQRAHDKKERLTDIAAVEPCGVLQIPRHVHICLPHQEYTKCTDKPRKTKRENRVQRMNFAEHQVLRNNENLFRNHHLKQDQSESKFTAFEFKSRKSIPRHIRCDNTGYDPDKYHCESVQIKPTEVQLFPRLHKSFRAKCGGKNQKRIHLRRLALCLECR